MKPSLQNLEYVVVNKLSYGIRFPRNVYELPWIGYITSLIVNTSTTDSILSQAGSFTYICNSKPNRGDVVAFNIPFNNRYAGIKRCVAISGDSLSELYNIYNITGINAFHKIVPYKGMRYNLSELTDQERNLLNRNRDFKFDPTDSSFVATDDFIYVLGDNVDNSEDSRIWGPIPNNLLIGRIITL